MRRTDENTRNFIAELLHSGWTPQDIAAEDLAELQGNFLHQEENSAVPSMATIARIAEEAGVSRPRGRPVGTGPGIGKGTKFSVHRERARELRSQGHSLRVIAAMLGLRSPQSVANLILDGESGKEQD